MTIDPVSGFRVALSLAGDGRLLLFGPDGAPAGAIEAPPGYRLSHLVETPDRLLVVGQGEAPVDGWHDWHFAIDVRSATLTRTSPAY